MAHEYDDEYPTCEETYATMRIFSDVLEPLEMTAALGVKPTDSFKKGDLKTKNPHSKISRHKTNGWLYSTKGKSTSRDCRRHLDILIEDMLRDTGTLAELRQRGCDIDITIFYVYTQGGPTISPRQMKALADAEIDVWWDLYRGESDDGSYDNGAEA